MAQLAIKGHPTRGKEVIQLLEMLGGKNIHRIDAIRDYCVYFVMDDKNKTISSLKLNQVLPEQFIIYSLEEFEEKFPYKVGDRIKHISAYTSGIVVKVTDKGYYIDYPKGKGVRYISSTLEKDYELVPNKFDITTLKVFDKVLVRDHNAQEWVASLFSNYNEPKKYKYICVNGSGYAQCIPYEGNEHLLGTANDCDEYFKTWE